MFVCVSLCMCELVSVVLYVWFCMCVCLYVCVSVCVLPTSIFMDFSGRENCFPIVFIDFVQKHAIKIVS